MMMYILLEYTYYSYYQGTQDRNIGYTLMYAPTLTTFQDICQSLIKQLYVNNEFEIIPDSIKDCTLNYVN
ncbi:hypothetical protein LCGC14_1227320 [marine sediment metagenome]|uniref:Uncharacterized protein n=1 Tax=marine sediment metagenome TaxID=412755 RepID=A0A0F9PDW1_9ZZZZ